MRATDVRAALDLGPAQAAEPFHLHVGPVRLTVLCPGPLRGELVAYFADALSDTPGDIKVHLLPGQALTPEPGWTDWAREPGKEGRKDAIVDLDDGRLVRKVRSGVTFLQSPDLRLAFGPLERNVSTVINFINTQILSACQQQGWQLAHAAAVTGKGRTLAISGLSGGGKSTSVLRMMDIDGTAFVSNDRLLVQPGTPPMALGIPKHPRINPGTILGNPRLHGMITAQRLAELKSMDPQALWTLEDKHDLMIGKVYGANRVRFAAPLTDFWVLNWSRSSTHPTRITPVDLSLRTDLLGAIMKSPGPFHQYPDGHFEPNGASPDPGPYLQALAGVTVSEVSGRIDFDAIAAAGRALFDG